MTASRFQPGQRVRDNVGHRDLWIHCGPLAANTGGPRNLWCCQVLEFDDPAHGGNLQLLVPDSHLSPAPVHHHEGAHDGTEV